jgi:hypothetical protein
MNELEEALNCMDRVCEIAMDMGDDYLDYLWQEVEKVPDEEEITLTAGALKSFFRTHRALEAYVMNDMDGVRHYLETKQLI